MADCRHFEKPLTRHNSAIVRQIAMKFGMMSHIHPLKPSDGQKLFLNQDGGQPMTDKFAIDILKATQQVTEPYDADSNGVHIGATWQV